MSINDSYNEEAIVEAIAVALDNFYTNLIKKVDSLNIKAVMKRKNPYLFRAKAMNGAAQIIDAILAAFVSSSEETIFGNVFFEPIATAAAQGQKALAEGVDIMVERDNTIYAIAVKSGTSVFNADSRKKQEQNFMAASKLAQQAKKRFVPIVGYGDNKHFVDTLNDFLQAHNNGKKNEPEAEKDYLRLFDKGEYNAAVIAAFRFLEITLSRKYDFVRISLMESLNLLNTNNAEDEEALYKVKKYRKIRNNIVHNNVNVGKREAKDIISCIEKLCASINSGNIIIL